MIIRSLDHKIHSLKKEPGLPFETGRVEAGTLSESASIVVLLLLFLLLPQNLVCRESLFSWEEVLDVVEYEQDVPPPINRRAVREGVFRIGEEREVGEKTFDGGWGAEP